MARTEFRYSIQRWLLACWLVGCSYACLATAVVMPHLYDATVASGTQSDDERPVLLKQGLLQVLERISGERGVERYPQVKKALENVPNFVEQYTYQGSQLLIKYSPDLINQLIHDIGHTVWGQRRPNVVLWLAVEQQQQRHLVGQETDPSLQEQLLKIAELQGLPIILPLMDLEDVSAVTVTDVWGGFPAVLRQASERYGANIILVGRVMHKDQGEVGAKSWQSQWQLLTESDMPTWEAQGQNLQEVLTQGIAGSTHYLINRFGVKNKATQMAVGKPFLLAVEDIKTAADFSTVENYLDSLDSVSHVNITQVLGNMAVFEITPQGENGRQALEQAIGLEHRFVLSAKESDVIAEVDLLYRWEP